MTSLIDVIFLLLLFFMLSSTFSKYGEIDLIAANRGPSAARSDAPPLFVKLTEEGVYTLNGEPVGQDVLKRTVVERYADGTKALILSISNGATSQQLIEGMTFIKNAAPISLTVVH